MLLNPNRKNLPLVIHLLAWALISGLVLMPPFGGRITVPDEYWNKPWCKVGDTVIWARYAGKPVEDNTGELYHLINDEDLKLTKTGSNGITVGSNTGVTDITFGALNMATTGTIMGAIKIISDSDGMSAAEMTTAGMYGTFFVATGGVS